MMNMFALTTVILIVAQAPKAADSDRSVEDRVRKEYPAALARLEAAYSRVQGKGRLTEHELDGKGAVISSRVTDIRFVRDGDRYYSIASEEGEGQPFERVRCTNPEYSFGLTREDRDGPYVIRSLGKGGKVAAPEYGLYYINGYVSAPYLAFGYSMSENLDMESYRLRKAREVIEGGRRLIKIEFDFRPAANYPIVPAWILVDPDMGWAIQRYEGLYGTKRNLPRTGSVEYTSTDGGRPIARRVVRTHVRSRELFEFEEIVFDRRRSEQDFRLTAFGLPEVNSPPVSGRSHARFLLFALGFLALLASLLLRYARRGFARRAGSSNRRHGAA